MKDGKLTDLLRKTLRENLHHHGAGGFPDSWQMAEGMDRAGIEPAFIYAFCKTGLIPTELNKDHMGAERQAEFAQAMDEFDGLDLG